MDYRKKTFNILNTLTRRREGYHQRLLEVQKESTEGKLRTIHEIFDSKENELDRYLHFDRYRRTSFLDHFIAEPMDFESFRRCQHIDEGYLLGGIYGIHISKGRKSREILFYRDGRLYRNGREYPVRLEKRYIPSLDRSILKAVYQISYGSDERKRTNFGIEFNINLLAGNAPDRYYDIPGHRLEDRRLASLGELKDVSEVRLINEWDGMEVVLRTDRSCNLWRFPVETVSLSESGFEKIFQGSCLLLYKFFRTH